MAACHWNQAIYVRNPVIVQDCLWHNRLTRLSSNTVNIYYCSNYISQSLFFYHAVFLLVSMYTPWEAYTKFNTLFAHPDLCSQQQSDVCDIILHCKYSRCCRHYWVMWFITEETPVKMCQPIFYDTYTIRPQCQHKTKLKKGFTIPEVRGKIVPSALDNYESNTSGSSTSNFANTVY